MHRFTCAAVGAALLAGLVVGAGCRSRSGGGTLGPTVEPIVLYFDQGRSDIAEDGYQDLRRFAREMGAFPEARVLVKGYSDGVGVDVMNEWLAHERAEAAARYLASLGVDPSRMVVEGVLLPAAAASRRGARPQRTNRRVDVTLLP